MKKYTWTKDMVLDLREWYPRHLSNEVTAMINKKYSTAFSNANIRNKASKEKISSVFSTRRKFIKENSNVNIKEFTSNFNKLFSTNCSISTMYVMRNRLKVKKCNITEVHLADYIGVSIPKEHEYYDMFKKYATNRNAPTIKSRVYVKRSLYNWIMSGRSIPKGYRLLHIDGDRYNDELDNLRLVPRGTLSTLIGILKPLGGLQNTPTALADANLAILEIDELKEKLNV